MPSSSAPDGLDVIVGGQFNYGERDESQWSREALALERRPRPRLHRRDLRRAHHGHGGPRKHPVRRGPIQHGERGRSTAPRRVQCHDRGSGQPPQLRVRRNDQRRNHARGLPRCHAGRVQDGGDRQLHDRRRTEPSPGRAVRPHDEPVLARELADQPIQRSMRQRLHLLGAGRRLLARRLVLRHRHDRRLPRRGQRGRPLRHRRAVGDVRGRHRFAARPGSTTRAAIPRWAWRSPRPRSTRADTSAGRTTRSPATPMGPGAVQPTGPRRARPRERHPLQVESAVGRSLGGSFRVAFLATSQGLWHGTDTDWVGTPAEDHFKLSFFPLAGGTTIAPTNTGTLPGTLFSLPPTGCPSCRSVDPVPGECRWSDCPEPRLRPELAGRQQQRGPGSRVPQHGKQRRHLQPGLQRAVRAERTGPAIHPLAGLLDRALGSLRWQRDELELPRRQRHSHPGAAVLREPMRLHGLGRPASLRRGPGRQRGPQRLRHRRERREPGRHGQDLQQDERRERRHRPHARRGEPADQRDRDRADRHPAGATAPGDLPRAAIVRRHHRRQPDAALDPGCRLGARRGAPS